MDIRNCKSCGRIFNYLSGQPICPSCRKKLEDKFDEVKEYIYDNKQAGLQEVSEEMDVSVSQIKQWVREERLTFSDDSPIGIECEGCGVTIKTGRFCKQCKNSLANDLKGLYAGPVVNKDKVKDKRESGRMRFLNK